MTITQLRNSHAVPMIGGESKPVGTYTNRIVIKLNCVFTGGQINTDLKRILVQYKFCPINIIKSHDLFHKVAGIEVDEATDEKGYKSFIGLLERDYSGTSCIPVTMDEYVLYTIEGHPHSIGAVFQFSLFNYSSYFSGSDMDRMEYWRFIPEWDAKEKKYVADSVVGQVVKIEDLKNTDPHFYKMWKEKKIKTIDNTHVLYRAKTLDLENALHPYNIEIEKILDDNTRLFTLDGRPEGSAVRVWKVQSAISPARKAYVTEIEDPLQWTQTVKDSLIYEPIVSNITIRFENNFAWLPVIGYSQPAAQYIGPGSTFVSLNYKTNNKKNISNLLRAYSEIVDNDTMLGAFYDDRYIVSTPLTTLAEAEIGSLKEVVINTVDGHPGWSDVNISFCKSTYAIHASEINPAGEGDDYWGLQRIFKPLESDEELSKKIKNLLEVAASTNGEKRINKAASAANLSGLNPSASDAFNKILDVMATIPMFSLPTNQSSTGQTLVNSIKITGSSPSISDPKVAKFLDIMKTFIDKTVQLAGNSIEQRADLFASIKSSAVACSALPFPLKLIRE